jgi:hypothetical protein
MMMGVPVVPSELTVHWMNVLQLSGLAYRQSLGPIHPVALMSSGGQKESLWAATPRAKRARGRSIVSRGGDVEWVRKDRVVEVCQK